MLPALNNFPFLDAIDRNARDPNLVRSKAARIGPIFVANTQNPLEGPRYVALDHPTCSGPLFIYASR